MQLDKTSIVITARNLSDTLDLSFVVVREYFKWICFYGVMGALPFAVLNFFLTLPMTRYEEVSMNAVTTSNVDDLQLRYYAIMLGAVFLQAPLAFSFLTSFIGQAVFQDVHSVRQVVQLVLPKRYRLIWILGILRFGLLSYIPLGLLFIDPQFQPFLELVVFIGLIVGVNALIRSVRPFAAEILILEGCPLMVPKGMEDQQLSYGKRSSWMSKVTQSESVGNHLIVTLVAGVLVLAMCGGFVFLTGVLLGVWEKGIWVDRFAYPAVLWMVGGWVTVFRFLSYTNVRIRTEGWELQLKLKAEANRLEGATS